MTDDKLTLSRRQVLGGAATIGIAGALGAGTWAQMSDTETTTVNATAGSIDLELTAGESTQIPVSFGSDLQNEDSETRTINLENRGSLDGKAVCFTIEGFSDPEHGSSAESESEAENSNVGTSGELDDVSNLEIVLTDENGTTYEVFNDRASALESFGGVCKNLGTALPPGGSIPLTLTLDVPADDYQGDNINQAMGDEFNFDLEITLYDNEQ